jgi:hypothetical protein
VAADGDIGADLEVGAAELVLDLLVRVFNRPPLMPVKWRSSLA